LYLIWNFYFEGDFRKNEKSVFFPSQNFFRTRKEMDNFLKFFFFETREIYFRRKVLAKNSNFSISIRFFSSIV